MKPLLLILTLGLTSISLCTTHTYAQDPTDDVETVIQQFFDAIAARDSVAFVRLMIPEAQAVALTFQEDRLQYRWRKGVDDGAMLNESGPAFLERMWEPEVRVDGPLATVWTRYDFYVDQHFSHCGRDAFQLLHIDGVWKVASVIYTTEDEPQNCPVSPLGPPTF